MSEETKEPLEETPVTAETAETEQEKTPENQEPEKKAKKKEKKEKGTPERCGRTSRAPVLSCPALYRMVSSFMYFMNRNGSPPPV